MSLTCACRIAKVSPVSVVAPRYMRGRHTSLPRNITLNIKKQVKDHIKFFPVILETEGINKDKLKEKISLAVDAYTHRVNGCP